MIWSNIDHAGKTSNKDGIATLKFKKQLQKKGKIEIQIEGEFYVKHIVYLDPELNYEIDVFLSESESYTNPQAIKYDIINYKIIEFNEAYIKFISIDGKITTWSKVD